MNNKTIDIISKIISILAIIVVIAVILRQAGVLK